MHILLERTYLKNGTHGVLSIDQKQICFTIELPWKQNAVRKSCIPEGEYTIRKRYSEKFKWHYIIEKVPNRSLILIHPANDAMKELLRCIAPVSQIVEEGKGIQSKLAMQKCREAFDQIKSNGTIKLCITSKK